MKRVSFSVLAALVVAVIPVMMLATDAGAATKESENTSYQWYTYSGQSECGFNNQYGEYIETAYAEAAIDENQCVYIETQVAYAVGSTIYVAGWAGGSTYGHEYESTAPYESVFGANVNIWYDTTSYGELENSYNFDPFG
jgi:hypothetical protein